MKEAVEKAERIEALQAERQRMNRGMKGDFGLGPASPARLGRTKKCEDGPKMGIPVSRGILKCPYQRVEGQEKRAVARKFRSKASRTRSRQVGPSGEDVRSLLSDPLFQAKQARGRFPGEAKRFSLRRRVGDSKEEAAAFRAFGVAKRAIVE